MDCTCPYWTIQHKVDRLKEPLPTLNGPPITTLSISCQMSEGRSEDLAHEVCQLVHGVGESLRLPLHGRVSAPLVSPEAELLQDCTHLLTVVMSMKKLSGIVEKKGRDLTNISLYFYTDVL